MKTKEKVENKKGKKLKIVLHYLTAKQHVTRSWRTVLYNGYDRLFNVDWERVKHLWFNRKKAETRFEKRIEKTRYHKRSTCISIVWLKKIKFFSWFFRISRKKKLYRCKECKNKNKATARGRWLFCA